MYPDDDIQEAAIGFTATPSTTRAYEINQAILYDVAFTNHGGYYNPFTSSFTCPVSGLYIFFQTTIVRHSNMQPAITRNSEMISSGWADSPATDGYEHGSNMSIEHCDAGDVIWVQVTYCSGDKTLYGNGDLNSAVSGVLIKPD